MEGQDNKACDQAPPYTEKSSDALPGSTSYSPPQPQGYGQQYDQQGYPPQVTGYVQQPYYQQPNPVIHQGSAPVVVVTSGQPYTVSADPRVYRSYCAQIGLSCFVFWCCGWVLGLIAFVLAMVASNSDQSGQHEEAERLGKASYIVSIVGIVVGLIIIAIIVGVQVSYANKAHSSSSGYPYYYTG